MFIILKNYHLIPGDEIFFQGFYSFVFMLRSLVLCVDTCIWFEVGVQINSFACRYSVTEQL